MGGTIVFILGILAVLVGIGVSVFASREGEGGFAVFAFIAGIVVGGAMITGACVGVVETKKVGVVTSFKKPTGEIRQAGAYWVAPWEVVNEMDAAKQVEPYEFDVQLAGGSKAHLVIYPSWQMAPDAAPELFQEFKSFEAVEKSLFAQQLVSTANNVFSSYNMLVNIDPKTGDQKKSKVEWAADLKAALEANPLIKGKLIINSVSIPTIQPDDNTQKNLDQIVAEFAKGSVLDQQKTNAEKQKSITETNAQVDRVTRCLEIAEKLGKEPGLCMSNGSGVIINTNK